MLQRVKLLASLEASEVKRIAAILPNLIRNHPTEATLKTQKFPLRRLWKSQKLPHLAAISAASREKSDTKLIKLCAPSHKHPPPFHAVVLFVSWHKFRFLSLSRRAHTEALQLSFPSWRDGKTISVSGEINMRSEYPSLGGETSAKRMKNYANTGISLKSSKKEWTARLPAEY